MKAEEIHISDFTRILFGNTPPVFLLEVIIRIAFLVLLVMITIRIMGKRMSSQLSLQEMGMLVILAGGIGIPMQTPERGLLPPVIIAILAIVIQRLFGMWSFKNKKFELITQGDVDTLIEDGILNLDSLKKNGLSRERVFAQVRYSGLRSLGRVKRLYMEANGGFSIIKSEQVKPGLSTIPKLDGDLINKQKKADDHFSCTCCVFTYEDHQKKNEDCPVCNSKEWVTAVI